MIGNNFDQEQVIMIVILTKNIAMIKGMCTRSLKEILIDALP